MYTIYKIENLVNNKIYYGQTSTKPDVRKSSHFRALRLGKHSNCHLQASWKKHGEQNFRFDVIAEDLNSDQADQSEKKLIEIFATMNPKSGYNRASGGKDRYEYPEYVKRPMSESNKGKRRSPTTEYKPGNIPYMTGRKHSEDSKDKNRKSHLLLNQDPLRNNPLKGRKMSAEARENCRLAQLRYVRSPGYKNPSKGKPNHRRTMVVDSTGFLWDSISLAAKFLKINPCIIVQAIKNNRPLRCNGLLFSKLI